MDIDDDFILDVSDSDIVDPKVGGHHGDSTHAPSAPSAPSVPMPEATTSILAEMSNTEYSFIQESVVRPQAPLLPEVIPQPPLSQAELIELRCARADLDRMRLAIEEQGKMLVSVTSRMHTAEERMHTAEEEVKSLKRTASREEPTP